MTSRLSRHSHCGQCIPCLARRIAFESRGISFKEYDRSLLEEDIGGLPPDDPGKRNLVDLLEFISRFRSSRKGQEDMILEQFPELYNDHVDRRQAISMYKRFAGEAMSVLQQYPNVVSLLG
jgi:hypothetical protein